MVSRINFDFNICCNYTFPPNFSGTICKKPKWVTCEEWSRSRRAGKKPYFSFYNLSVQFEFAIYIFLNM